MLEIGIICIITLAVGYWVTLWLMGRHDDVLHGDFVHAEQGAEASALTEQPIPARPPFPAKPAARPAAAKPAPSKALPAQPLPAPASTTLSERSDTLQTLLASIKRDLKDASQL
jgi:hypothetical protein